MNQQLRELAARILHLSPDTITPELSMDNCVNWTSLAHVELIASLEETFGVTVGEDELFDLLDMASILTFLERARPGDRS